MDPSAIRALLDTTFAPWIRDLALAPESTTDTSATLRLPHANKLRHAGGVICGQVFMAAADTAMIVAISAALGGFKPMSTVSQNVNFMRAVRKGDNLVFGEVELFDETGHMAVHATTTYALLD